MSTQVPEVRPTSSAGGRRAARDPGRRIPRYDSWQGVVWTVVLALDFFWFANPRVLVAFPHALWSAAVVTAVGAAVTVSRLRAPVPAESVLAVLILGFASALWSIDPDQTFAFTMRYVLIAAVATIIARNADARAIAHGLVLGGLIFLGASIYAMARDLPGSLGPSYADTHFAGVGGNRNILAYTLVLAFAGGAGLVPRSRWARGVWALALVTLLGGVYLAHSATGLITATLLTVIAVACYVLDRRRLTGAPVDPRRRRLVWVVALAGVVAMLVGGLVVGKILGRNTTTLSGRTTIWEAIWKTTTGEDRWIGSGWGAVWRHPWAPAPENPKFREIVATMGFPQWHGHNWAFDLIPELGLLGVVVFATVYVQAGVRAVRLRTYDQPATGVRLQTSRIALLGLLGVLMYGVTESMSTIPLGWFTTVLLATGLAVPVRRRSARPRAQEADAGPPSQAEQRS